MGIQFKQQQSQANQKFAYQQPTVREVINGIPISWRTLTCIDMPWFIPSQKPSYTLYINSPSCTGRIVPTVTILGCGFNASPPSQIFRIKSCHRWHTAVTAVIVTRSARDLGLWTTVTRRHLKSSHNHRGLSPRHMVVAWIWFKIWTVELLEYAGMFGFPALSREVIVTWPSQARRWNLIPSDPHL